MLGEINEIDQPVATDLDGRQMAFFDHSLDHTFRQTREFSKTILGYDRGNHHHRDDVLRGIGTLHILTTPLCSTVIMNVRTDIFSIGKGPHVSKQKLTMGQRIQAIREKEGLTRVEFAKITGIPKDTLVGYEFRGKDPAGSSIEKIASAFPEYINFLVIGK